MPDSASRDSSAMDSECFDERFGAIISKMDNHRMQINGMNKDILRIVQKATADFGGAGIDSAVTENKALKEQINGLKNRVNELEDENKRLSNDYTRLDKENIRLEKDHAFLKDDLRDANIKNRGLEDELNESRKIVSHFMELSSRLAGISTNGKRAADTPGHSDHVKRTRHSYGDALSEHNFQQSHAYSENGTHKMHLDRTSRRDFRDYSPSEHPHAEPLDELRNRDDIYSNSGNAQDKVSEYLARLPANVNDHASTSTLQATKSPFSAEEIIIKGKANHHVTTRPSGHEMNGQTQSLTSSGHAAHSEPIHHPDAADGFVEVHEGAKIWRRNTNATNGFHTGNSLNDNSNLNSMNDSVRDEQAHQNGASTDQLQQFATQQKRLHPRRRIVCHSCWQIRGRCDNRHTCGNCAAEGKECVRSICVDFARHGDCPRGIGCFKIHDEEGYKAINWSPFSTFENKRRFN